MHLCEVFDQTLSTHTLFLKHAFQTQKSRLPRENREKLVGMKKVVLVHCDAMQFKSTFKSM